MSTASPGRVAVLSPVQLKRRYKYMVSHALAYGINITMSELTEPIGKSKKRKERTPL